VQDPLEMHETLTNVVAKLSRSDLGPAFQAAFGSAEVTADRVARALEQYLFTLVSGDSRFDRAMRGGPALSVEEQRGFELFHTEHDPRRGQFGADCFHCHGGALFSDQAYHNNGLDLPSTTLDAGRSAVTGKGSDFGKFKTPSLRNVARTAPYMHDGRFRTLEQVVAHYCSGVKRSSTLDPNLAKHPDNGVALGPDDQKALVAFLKTLTDVCFGR
jgi:cytochrome c peroxidase